MSKDGSVYLLLQQSGWVKREVYTYCYSRVDEERRKLIAKLGPELCCSCGGCPGQHDGQHQMVRLALYRIWSELCCSCPQFVVDTLISTADNHIEREGVLATKLCTHKDDVVDINSKKLNALAGWCCCFGFPLYTYHAPQNDTSVSSKVPNLIKIPKYACVYLYTRNHNSLQKCADTPVSHRP